MEHLRLLTAVYDCNGVKNPNSDLSQIWLVHLVYATSLEPTLESKFYLHLERNYEQVYGFYRYEQYVFLGADVNIK